MISEDRITELAVENASCVLDALEDAGALAIRGSDHDAIVAGHVATAIQAALAEPDPELVEALLKLCLNPGTRFQKHDRVRESIKGILSGEV